VPPVVFNAISSVDVCKILKCSNEQLRPILPCLVRMSLITPLDHSATCLNARTRVLQVLSRIDTVNNIVALLSINFFEMLNDLKKEQQLRQKVGGGTLSDSVLIKNLSSGPSLDFERMDHTRKLRLVLSELLTLMHSGGGQKPSELFDQMVHLPDLCDVLTICLAELPVQLHPTDVCEALLKLKYGPEMICHVVANQSESFSCVVSHLIKLAEKADDDIVANSKQGGSTPNASNPSSLDVVRHRALVMLARMNPVMTLTMRDMCVDTCSMPGLAVSLALEYSRQNPAQSDLVSWVTGLILGTDMGSKNWFSLWIRNAAKKKSPELTELRSELCRRVSEILDQSKDDYLNVTCLRDSLALLRLFTALRGIAGMKFTEEEVKLLISLITKKPPPSKLGVRFAGTGLCILIACNSLLSQPGHEKLAGSWVRWLMTWSDCPSEMLLLAAIHFHAGQLTQVADLVCQTLNIKMSVRTNSMTVIKRIFTQEIFTEIVVAQHAVKVPVTASLSSSISGFLPVHCIHQLLRSRVFSKHRVNIKPWIYQQLLCSQAPLHPVLPPLIEAYISSILTTPSSRSGVECHNDPLTEAEIRAVFAPPLFNLDSVTNNKAASGLQLSTNQRAVSSSGYSAQLCILYYILLYEDTRLVTSHNRQVQTSSMPRHHRYSQELLNDLPIKFLLGKAERMQGKFEGLFPPLLRLASTQFPHLCLVEDGLVVEKRITSVLRTMSSLSISDLSSDQLKSALDHLVTCPAATNLQLQHLLSVPPRVAWSVSNILVSSIRTFLDPRVPRHTQELFKQVWLRLNTVYPRKLWLMTVNSLNQLPPITAEELAIDPLSVLRCDSRVFRSGPILHILLYMLKACLAASRTRLGQYCVDQQLQNTNIQEAEREELKNSLILTQESTAIQILLETCQETKEELLARSRLSDVQETQSAVCCYLHQAFIEDTSMTLAKLVHFQGYPHSLLGVTTAGVPSLFICLDTSPELLSQPSIEKQVFAVDLISHLCVIWSMPKSLSYARLAVNSLSTLLGVLAARERRDLIEPSLPALVRICRAFPPLVEDCLQLLVQSSSMYTTGQEVAKYFLPNYSPSSNASVEESFTVKIVKTFQEIIAETVTSNRIF